MSALTKILTGAAGLAAAVGFASPAAAQYYPNQGYGYNNNGGVLGAIVNSVIGGNQYGHRAGNSQYAVAQCARAVEARIGGNRYGGYGYNQGYARGRVLGVTQVEQRRNGLRVRGVASSGQGYGYGYNSGGQADLNFRCNIDYRGRITDIDLDRRGNRYGSYRGY
ncbi:MAG: hypothetical protein M3Q83_02575 [Pseudomonadota bacterium]|nr:hypothetical protein [Pseudomonadota bacterium]